MPCCGCTTFASCSARHWRRASGLQAPLYVVGFLQFFSGVGLTIDNALWWTAMQQHVPKESISRVSSYDWAGTLAVAPIGYALVGPLAGAVGVSAAIIACSIGVMAVTASSLLVRDIRMLPSKPIAGPDRSGHELAEA